MIFPVVQGLMNDIDFFEMMQYHKEFWVAALRYTTPFKYTDSEERNFLCWFRYYRERGFFISINPVLGTRVEAKYNGTLEQFERSKVIRDTCKSFMVRLKYGFKSWKENPTQLKQMLMF